MQNKVHVIAADVLSIQAKQALVHAINNFIRERIMLAGDAISQETCSSIRNGDVILIYSWFVM